MLIKLPSGQEWDSTIRDRAVGRSENPGVSLLLCGHNLPPLVQIGLTHLPKSGGAPVDDTPAWPPSCSYKSVEDPNILVPSVLVSFCSTILQHPLRWLSETVPYCVWWKMRLWDVKDGIKRGGSGWAARLRRCDGGGAALVAEGLLPQQPQYRYILHIPRGWCKKSFLCVCFRPYLPKHWLDYYVFSC